MDEYIIKFQGLSKKYTSKNIKKQVINNLDIGFRKHKITCIVGKSGSGKTTLLKILANLVSYDEGELKCYPEGNIGYIPQKNSSFPWYTIERNVSLGIEDKKLVQDAINKVGLVGYEKYYPYQLSGGLYQRIAIARELLRKSEVLLLDEPFSALDFESKIELDNLLINLKNKNDMTIIMITHDVNEAVNVADDLVLVQGSCLNKVKIYKDIKYKNQDINNLTNAIFQNKFVL